MRDELRDHLSKEITRKQFLQYMAGATLTIFGFNNLISLITGSKRHLMPKAIGAESNNGFGTRKFGV